jgi:hypothetical protein
MTTPTPLAHGFSSIIHAWMTELAPKVQPSFHDIEQWHRDTLVWRYCIVSAELRDTSIRIVEGFPDPPANADLTWWRNNVASPANSWCLRLWSEKEMLPLVLEETEDPFVVHVLIGLLIGFFYICSEFDRRLEAQEVSHLARRMFDDAIVNPLEVQKEAHQTLCKLIRERANKKKADENHALLGLFQFFEDERLTRPVDSHDYAVLAGGPLQASYPPKVHGWDAMAGQLLVEHIHRMNDQYRPLLAPDLDIHAIGSALDAERERYRESLAKERGGPGTVDGKIGWKCCGQFMKRTVKHCPTCCNELPGFDVHVSLDDDEQQNDGKRGKIQDKIGDRICPTPYEAVLAHEMDERIANVKKHLPSNVLLAFQQIKAGETDERAAAAAGISKKTIQRWRNKFRFILHA